MNNLKKIWKKKFAIKKGDDGEVTLVNVQKRGSYAAKPEENTKKLTTASKSHETEEIPREKTPECKTKDVETESYKNETENVKQATNKQNEDILNSITGKEDGKESKHNSADNDSDLYETVDYSAMDFSEMRKNGSGQGNETRNIEHKITATDNPNYDEIVLPTQRNNIQDDLTKAGESKQYRRRERDYEEVDITPVGLEIRQENLDLEDYSIVSDEYRQGSIPTNSNGRDHSKLNNSPAQNNLIEPTYMTVDYSKSSFLQQSTPVMKEGDISTPDDEVEEIEPDYITINTSNLTFPRVSVAQNVEVPEQSKETSEDDNVESDTYAIINKESKSVVSDGVEDDEGSQPAPPVPNKDKLLSGFVPKECDPSKSLTPTEEENVSKNEQHANNETGTDKATEEDALYDLPYTKMETHALKMAMLSSDGDYSTVAINFEENSTS